MIKKTLNEECIKRIEVAKKISSKCTLDVKEIIVAGSVSRNLADERSDIEIEFLVDNMILEKTRIDWIKEIGGEEIHSYGGPIGDGSEWIIFKYRGFYIELGCQTINAMIENINPIIEGKVYSHEKLILASTMKNAILIKDSGIMSKLKADLEFYPSNLSEKIILSTIEPWLIELGLEVRKNLARRGDKIPLLERLIGDVHRVLRILFAINKKWEVDYKWINYIVEDLDIKPKNLKSKVDSIITMNDSKESTRHCFELICETLELIPKELKLNEQIKNVISTMNKMI